MASGDIRVQGAQIPTAQRKGRGSQVKSEELKNSYLPPRLKLELSLSRNIFLKRPQEAQVTVTVAD